MKTLITFSIIAGVSLLFAGCPMSKEEYQLCEAEPDSSEYQKMQAEMAAIRDTLTFDIGNAQMQLGSLQVVFDGAEIRAKVRRLEETNTSPNIGSKSRE